MKKIKKIKRNPTGNNEPHPWKKWLSKKREFTLVKGVDFNCAPHGLAAQFRNKGYKRGIKMSIRLGENSITVKIKSA